MNLFSGAKGTRIPAILLLIFTARLSAQTTGAGSITGTISDPSGGAVPGASVVIKNTATSGERSLTTNDAGIYVAQFLKPDLATITW